MILCERIEIGEHRSIQLRALMKKTNKKNKRKEMMIMVRDKKNKK